MRTIRLLFAAFVAIVAPLRSGAAPEQRSPRAPDPWAAIHRVERGIPAAGDPSSNVFLEGETVLVRLPRDRPGEAIAWQVLEDRGEVIARGQLAERATGIEPGKLGIGWYRVEFLDAKGACIAWTTAAVLARLAAPTPQDSPICVDAAVSWFAPDDPANQERFARLAALAGVNWMRDRMRWQAIQPSPDGFAERTTYDSAATLQSRFGLKVLQVFHDTPTWAVGEGSSTGRLIGDLRILHRYCKAMAERYRGRIQAWEPWNEANCPVFGGHTADEMCSYQKAAYLGFKAADPGVVVCMNVATGIPTRLHALVVNANETWPYFDTYNFHTYDLPESYDGLWGPVREAAAGRPIWITESDRAMLHESGPPWYDLSRRGEILKAHFIAQSYASSLFAGANRHFQFILGHYIEGQNPVQFGLLRLDKTPRPSYVALAAIGRLLAGARCIGRWRIADRPEAHVYAFRSFPDGVERDVLIAWAERPVDWADRGKAEVAWSLPAELSVRAVFDYLGRRATIPERLGSAPVFVLLDPGGAERLPLKRARGSTFRAGAPASVVLQVLMPRKATKAVELVRWSMEHDYVVDPGGEIDLPLYAYNLSETAARGVVRASHVPAGWRMEPDRWEVAIKPLDREKLETRLRRPPGTAGDRSADTWIILRGEFEAAGRPVLAFRVAAFPGEGYDKGPTGGD